jgi:hypothetical protein
MDSMVRFMAFMQRSDWWGFSWGRGGLARLCALGVLTLLAGCQGAVTTDLATELPADPNITQVVTFLRGVEFSTSSGGTKTLEFTTSEQVNLINLAQNNGALRLFTSEDLPEGNYTGVRLLFDENRANDAFVFTLTTGGTTGTKFPVNLTEGDYAPLSFSVDKNKNSTDSFTLVLDLRMSLSFDTNNREYNLAPKLRAVETSVMSSIQGTVSVTCPTGTTLARGAVYLFQGRDITPDDIDGTGVEPFATAPVFTSSNGNSFFYTLRYLPAGNYTLAVTCEGNDENPTTDQDLRFRNAVNVSLDNKETLTRNLP